MEKKIKIKYNGRRFPRIVSIQNGGKMSFQPDRLVLELNEYDALFLLKSNSRLTPDKWAFTVAEIGFKEPPAPKPVAQEAPIPKKEDIEPVEEKPKPSRPGKKKKAMST